VPLGGGADKINVFESGPPVDAQIGQVLSEKPGTFAEQKNRDQGQDNDGHNRVTAEEGFDRIFRGETTAAGGRISAKKRGNWGGDFHLETMRTRFERGKLISVTIL
jgi:hypothetical protein